MPVASARLIARYRGAALAQVEHEERTLASAVQWLGRERVNARDMATMTGLSEAYVTRLLKMKLEADRAAG